MLTKVKKRRENPRANGPAADDARWRVLDASSFQDFARALAEGDVWVEIQGMAQPGLFTQTERCELKHHQHVKRWQRVSLTDHLSYRELQIFMGIAQGLSNGAMARQIFCSSKTISTFMTRVLAKTGFTTTAQIAVYAYREGLTTWPLPNQETEHRRAWRLRRERVVA